MDELNSINIFVDEKEVVRLLGHRIYQLDKEIIHRIQKEIKNSKKYIEPSIYFKQINIRKVKEEVVVLENEVVLQGRFIADKLSNCNYVVACISTLGDKVDLEINKAFKQEDSLKGMIIDSIGTVALEYINKIFWNKIVDEIQESDIGITARFSPGNRGWKITEQQKIFDCIGEENTRVKLLEASFMLPMKSTSQLYGFGKNIGIARVEHVCSECSMQNCSYRK